jgi:hypothetical protein
MARTAENTRTVSGRCGQNPIDRAASGHLLIGPKPMSTCVYCDREADSLEHVLPASFGEFERAPNLVDRICTKCNNSLGLLDEQYSRCGPEAFFRMLYGIQGRSKHDKVNIFERGSAGGQRFDFKAKDENLGIEVALECENGTYRQMRQLVFVEQSGKTHHLPIREGSTSGQLRTAFEKLAVAKPFDVHIFYGPEEKDWVETLLKETWPAATFAGGTLGSAIYQGAAGTIVLTNRYFRAIAKIGFHYFLTQFPQYSGREPLFKDIREYILDDKGGVDRANDFIGERQNPLLAQMTVPGARPDGWRAHVLGAEISPGHCRAHVQMFISGDWPSRPYTITLAKDQSITDTQASGTFYVYVEKGLSSRFVGEAASGMFH